MNNNPRTNPAAKKSMKYEKYFYIRKLVCPESMDILKPGDSITNVLE